MQMIHKFLLYDANELIVKLNFVLIQVRKWFMKNSSFNSVTFIDHFRVPKTITFKTRLGAKPFLRK